MRVRWQDVNAQIVQRFNEIGLATDEAEVLAQQLEDSERRGKRSHGYQRFKMLWDWQSRVVLRQIQIQQLTSSVLHLDGGNHPGTSIAQKAASHLQCSVRRNGVCLAAAHSCGPTGQLGFFLRPLAQAGLASIMSASTLPLCAPMGGAEAVLGTNPIAIALPGQGKGAPPIVFDASTAETTLGAIQVALRRGDAIPPNVLLRNGRPVILPSDHRLSGMAFLLEILSGLISGARVGRIGEPTNLGFWMLVFDPRLLISQLDYENGLEGFLKDVSASEPLAGQRIRIPGEASERNFVASLSEAYVDLADSVAGEIFTSTFAAESSNTLPIGVENSKTL